MEQISIRKYKLNLNRCRIKVIPLKLNGKQDKSIRLMVTAYGY